MYRALGFFACGGRDRISSTAGSGPRTKALGSSRSRTSSGVCLRFVALWSMHVRGWDSKFTMAHRRIVGHSSRRDRVEVSGAYISEPARIISRRTSVEYKAVDTERRSARARSSRLTPVRDHALGNRSPDFGNMARGLVVETFPCPRCVRMVFRACESSGIRVCLSMALGFSRVCGLLGSRGRMAYTRGYPRTSSSRATGFRWRIVLLGL